LDERPGARRSFDDLVEEADKAPILGWDFSWLDGRAEEERPAWGYHRLLAARVARASVVIDLQSGGGELLAGLPELPELLVATEGWKPNVAVAARRLQPLGAHVVATRDDRPDLPFRDGAADLISSRHPVTTWWAEIARVLRPGGTFLSQQVGPHSVGELTEFFLGPQPPVSTRDPAVARAGAEAAGLEVVDLRSQRLRTLFYDVGAVVYFLRLVVWIVPGFSVDAYGDRLAELHDQIESDGPFLAYATRFLIEARKAPARRGGSMAPEGGGDPVAAWLALRESRGRAATVIDLYALVANPRGLQPHELPRDERVALVRSVMHVIWPGFEVTERSDRADPIEVVDYDDAWPARYQRWRERIATALGPIARRVEHVGSTSVPGLPAKPIVDIQVSVTDMADESAYVPDLERVGVQLRSRDSFHRYFRPFPGRPRHIHVHVCNVGSEWEREHLLFRDYLRLHPDDARRYAAAKSEAARRWADDGWAYTDAKTEVILGILARAEVWSQSRRWRP
jgi:GrpB-like predicted nucleotidyltransferase (UPF0157 family)/SAM-dependent methyltransferase